MRQSLIYKIKEYVQKDSSITDELALMMLESDDACFADIIDITEKYRLDKWGNKVSLCAITSAKSGPCSEDCRFCAQSGRYDSGKAMPVNKITQDELAKAYEQSGRHGCSRFSPVSTGRQLQTDELHELCDWITQLNNGPSWCASLGCLDLDSMQKLRKSGVKRYHHNIETARSFFPQVCSSHTFTDRLQTLENARKAGMEICSGGVMGLGESNAQRVEFARTLQEIHVDSIPLNFLLPIPGTPCESSDSPTAGEILRMIAMTRLVCPEAEIRLAAGRSLLGSHWPEIFRAGATGFMMCDFLTVKVSDANEDLETLKRSGYEIE